MKRLMALVFVSVFAGTIVAQTLSELRLKDGRVLKDLVVLGYAQSSFMAKWAGGRGTIAYADLPSEMRAAFEARRPAKTPEPEDRTGVVVIGSDGVRRTVPVGTEPQKPEWKSKIPPAPDIQLPQIAMPKEEALLATTVTGQAFVSTKGGDNIKLGGIRVAAYPKTVIDQLLTWDKTEGNKAIEWADRAFNAALDAHDFESEKALASGPSQARYARIDFLPKPIWWTTSDADGRFILKHKVPAPYVIVARGKRSLGDREEIYVWLVPSTDIPPSGEFLLHNDNME